MAQKLTFHFLALAAMLPSLGLANLEASVANAKRVAQRAGLEIELDGSPTNERDILGNGFSYTFHLNGWEIFAVSKGDVVSGSVISPLAGEGKRFRQRPKGFSQSELIAKAEGHLQKLGLVKGRDFELRGVIASGDEKYWADGDALIGGQRMDFIRPAYLGFRDGMPVASFTYYIPDGRLMAFSIMVGLGKPPLPEPNLISVREGAVKARAAAVTFAERAYPDIASKLPSAEEIEETVVKAWRGPFRSPEEFPTAPYPKEFLHHTLASYNFQVGPISVFVRASNGEILGGGMLALDRDVPTSGLDSGTSGPTPGSRRSTISPEVMAYVSGAPVVPDQPAPAPMTPAEPSRAPVAPPAGMPLGLVALAGGAFALILGAWAIWGRKR